MIGLSAGEWLKCIVDRRVGAHAMRLLACDRDVEGTLYASAAAERQDAQRHPDGGDVCCTYTGLIDACSLHPGQMQDQPHEHRAIPNA